MNHISAGALTMAEMTYRTKVELGVTVACLVIGGFFTYEALRIPAEEGELIGSRTVPLFLAVLIMALGVLASIVSIVEGGNGEDEEEIPAEDEYGFADSDVVRVFQVIGCGVVYIAMFWAFGYLLSTFVALLLMLLAFGNRRWRPLILMPLIGTVVYEFVFMGLMGLYDPAGALVDLSALSNLISGN
jgi:hypothetical protein